MKMKRIILSVIMMLALSAATGTETLKLEHEFDGYYFPYNFPLYLDADNDRYFYPMIISANKTTLSLKTYNEDYTTRDCYSVTFAVPDGYKTSSISYSSSLKLHDGTPFFIVTFQSTEVNIGESGYHTAAAFDCRTGRQLFDFESATGGIMCNTTIYLINGRPSIVVLYYDYNRNTNGTTYYTRIYSFGEGNASATLQASDAPAAAPIITYDITGRIIENPMPGQIHINRYSDGTTKKMVR